MARHCWRHGWPAILLALVLVGSGQAVDVDSKLNERKQSTGFESNSLQDNGFFPDTPKDLMVELSCQNEGFFTWDYTSNTEGFLATICSQDGVQCISKTIRASARNFTVKLPKPDAGLTVSLWAYWKLLFIRIFSEPASIEFSSYPKVPDIKSLTVTPLNYSAIQATWKEEWAHEIKFLLCRTPKECLVRMVQGKLRQHTFNGLAPESEYTIFALAQVTLKNKTCHGLPESRTAQTFAKQPGPVLNLKYEIVNSVILNATWDAPNGTHAVDGYTIECKDIKGTYDVARDVIETESSVTATLLLRKFARTFKCSVWAFINSTLHGRVNGTKTMFEVATHNLESPVGLNVIVDCENQANATWNYERRVPITGFVVNLCWMNGSLCENKTLSPTTEEVSYELQENDARYNISVAAFVDDSLQTIHSSPTTEEFFSFPKLPDLKSLTLTPLNYSAIKATWKEEWAHEIIFLVCNTPKECKKHFVEGRLQQHTFNGLTPDSAYTISAQAQVALNNKTCQGPPESRTAPTFPRPPGPVLNLKYEIVDSVFLNANWDAPNDTKPVDGYTIECRDVEGAYDVARDVFEIKSSVNVTLPLVKFASTFNCSVWAFTNSSLHGRANGTKTVFEVATPNLEPPVDLNVVVHCENQASITWNYELGVSITGFVANLCWMNGSVCKNRTIPGPFRDVSYRLQEYGALYTISVVAYVINILQTIYSRPTTAKFFSFPKLPELDGLSVSALNSTALHAIWKEKWDHEIEFQVCTTAYDCQNDTVLGTLQQHTFSGLQPDTEYNVSAHSEVTLNNRTCKGPLQNRSATTFAEAPDPVSNLKHKIVNSVFLNAEWDAPNDTKPVDGYTIECKDIDGVYDVARDVFQTKSSVNVTLRLVKFASTFNCSVWAFIYSSLHKRVNGTKTVFEVATPNLEPPVDLNVIVDCENQANVTWNYELGVSITGFVAKICWMNGSVCKNRTLPGPARDVSYRLQEYGALYTISLVAYVENSLQTIYSLPTTENFSSFPKLPELDGLSVSALNSTALRARWKEKWSHEIEFHVCTTPYDCQNNTVPGTLLQHIFSSLQPDTEYNVSAQAEVTLNNRTCKGPLQSSSASTYPEVPGNVTDLKHHVQNGIILVASWNSPKEAKAVKGYTISCIDSKTGKNVTADVDTLERSVQVRLNLHEPVGGFECAVWAYNKNKKGQRVLGPKSTFEVTTNGIFPPRDVKLFQRTATSLTYTWIADPTAPGWNITPVAKGQLAYSGIEEYGESDNKTVTHNVTSLLPWTTYNVSIVNCRPTFCSEPTFVQSTTDVAAPSEVRDLHYTIVEDVHVRLTWKEPEHPNGPIDGYSVAVFNEDQQEGTIYDVEGRLNETTIDLDYQFNIFNICVRAYNVDKVRRDTIGGPVSEVEFETLGEGPMPPRPKFGAVGSDSVYLSWEFPEDPRYNITGFNISVSHKKPFITHERNFTLTSLEPWMDYNVSVASCTNATECGHEYDRHFKTDVGEPSEPLDFKVGSASTDWFLLEWKQPKVHNGPLSGYNVTLKKDEGEVQETTTQLSYNFTGLTAGTAYKVSVYAFNDGLTTSKRGPGTTLWAATLSEKTSTPTILLATFIPLILLFALVAAFYLYKRYQKRPGDRQPLTAAEGH